MAEWRRWCQGKLVSPEEAVSGIRPGERVVFGMTHPPGTMWAVANALAQRKDELRGEKKVIVMGFPGAPRMGPEMEEAFELWGGAGGGRGAGPRARVEHAPEPWCLRHPDRLLEPGRASVSLGADWAVIPVGVPNHNGYISFGSNCWANLSTARTARKAIGVAHPEHPFTYGDTIHISELAYLVESVPTPAEYVVTPPHPSEEETRAAERLCAWVANDLIRDGDTLQIGMGLTASSLPRLLTHKNDLGIHSEALSMEGILGLVKTGVVNGRRKNINRGKSTLAQPTQINLARYQEYRDFVDGNPLIEFRDQSYVNNPVVIASHDNMVAINIVVCMDLRGQVQTDVQYAGLPPVGGLAGAVDFLIGSHFSRGGRAITLLPSTAQRGKVSRIVPVFPEGAQVMIPCFFVDYVVTEHGVVNLEGRTMRQRAEALISIAHPDFQPELRQAAKKMV